MMKILFLLLCGMPLLMAQGIEDMRKKYELKPLASAPKAERSEVLYYAYYFFSPECPLSVNYTAALHDDSLNDAITRVVIIPGQESRKVTSAYIRRYLKGHDVYRDKKCLMTKSFDVKVTPEVVLLTKDGELVYQGLIDDWVTALGAHKKKASRFYLQEAYTAHAKKQNYIARTTAIGCFINLPLE
jgi:hypothetical protein